MRFIKMPIYQKSLQVLEVAYCLSNVLPKSEVFNMVSQINRAALSISSNIAEGSGRGSDKEFARFISIAIGSTYEVYSLVIAIEKIHPIAAPMEIHSIKGLLNDLVKELEGFRKFLLVD